jgi:predicted Zn-dependent protease
MPICKDETGIAVVMGHEVAHAIANHGGERMSQGLIQQFGGMAISVALQEKPKETQQLAMAAYGAGSTVLGILPYSRLHESEADKMGLIFMAMAGYNPQEAPVFWERMSSMNKGKTPPEFLSTHPADETRIKDLKNAMPEALNYYTKK